jgi:uncharacterized membrane protein
LGSRNVFLDESVRNILLSIAIIMGFVFLVSFTIFFIKDSYGTSCRCKDTVSIIVAALTSLGVFVGIITFYFLSKNYSKDKQDTIKGVEKILLFLENEEKIIIECLIKNNGVSTQSKLVKLTKMDSVKLHRRLLVLESKNIVKKEKLGMTNRIILDNDILELFQKMK